ncbi:MAG: O-antigen ligase family protein [Clostridium sp.]
MREGIKGKNKQDKAIFAKIYILISLIIPYGVLGYASSNMLLVLIGFIGLILTKNLKFDKKTIIMMGGFSVYVIIHTMMISRTLNSIVGSVMYLLIPVSYLIFSTTINKKNYKEIMKVCLSGITGVAIIAIIYQGIIGDIRIDGNLGYANSYALILLIGIYINKELSLKYRSYIDIILYVGILFTGSRTTLILLIIYGFINFIRDKELYKIQAFVQGLIIYVLLEKYLAIAILIFPLIVYSISIDVDKKNEKKILVISLLVVGILSSIGNINTIERVKNISINNGSFKERIISFEDSISAIKNKPLGYGINNYIYENGEFKTANYNIRYIHNSILHTIFEIGILGGVLLIGMFIYLGVKIYKKDKFKDRFIIFIMSIIHSLMDFDFAYGTILILLVLIATPTIEDNKEKKVKIAMTIPIVIVIILLGNELILVLGKQEIMNKEYSKGIGIIKRAIIKDFRYDYILGDAYYLKYLESANEKDIKLALKSIEEARDKYENNLIKHKEAQIQKELSYEKYVKIMEEIFESYKYYPYYYKDFYEVAKENGDELLIKAIENKHALMKGKINIKAKGLPKQIIDNYQ